MGNRRAIYREYTTSPKLQALFVETNNYAANANLPPLVEEIVGFVMEDMDLELDKAMELLFGSQLFDKLHDIETGLYLEGSAYVYDFLKEELAQAGDEESKESMSSYNTIASTEESTVVAEYTAA